MPIDPNLDLDALIAQQPNFQTLSRVDARTLDSSPDGLNTLENIIHQHVIVAGLPLVIENWHLRSDWPRWLFNPQWLGDNHGHDCLFFLLLIVLDFLLKILYSYLSARSR